MHCQALMSIFFFNDTATTEIYTLSLHDALPIHGPRHPGQTQAAQHVFVVGVGRVAVHAAAQARRQRMPGQVVDRKSTRLNSSHLVISYAVFCLKKKKDK